MKTLETAMFRGFSFCSNHNEFHDLPVKSLLFAHYLHKIHFSTGCNASVFKVFQTSRFAHFLHKQVCHTLSRLHDAVALLMDIAVHRNGNLNISELARVCELSRPTVYKYLRLLKK